MLAGCWRTKIPGEGSIAEDFGPETKATPYILRQGRGEWVPWIH